MARPFGRASAASESEADAFVSAVNNDPTTMVGNAEEIRKMA